MVDFTQVRSVSGVLAACRNGEELQECNASRRRIAAPNALGLASAVEPALAGAARQLSAVSPPRCIPMRNNHQRHFGTAWNCFVGPFGLGTGCPSDICSVIVAGA